MEVDLASQVFLSFCISDTGYRGCKTLSHSKYNIPPSENYRITFCFLYLICFRKKVAAPGLENRDLTVVGTRCADHVTPLYPQNLALTSLTGGGRSVGMVRSRTQGHGVFNSFS
jgi:hypothetical protein